MIDASMPCVQHPFADVEVAQENVGQDAAVFFRGHVLERDDFVHDEVAQGFARDGGLVLLLGGPSLEFRAVDPVQANAEAVPFSVDEGGHRDGVSVVHFNDFSAF